MSRDVHGDDADVTLLLRSGKTWRPFAPNPDDFEWDDVAFALGRIPRFNGQLPAWGDAGSTDTYVVAQHLCLCLDLLEQTYAYAPIDLRLAVLLHDGEEALGGLGDPVGPVKHSARFRGFLVPYFAAIQYAIAEKADIPRELITSCEVKDYDRAAFAIENYFLRGISPKPGCSLQPIQGEHRNVDGSFRCWSVPDAGAIWRSRLSRLLYEKRNAQ